MFSWRMVTERTSRAPLHKAGQRRFDVPLFDHCYPKIILRLFVETSKMIFGNLGTTPILKKNALGVKGPFSEHSGAFSEQFSEWHSRPNLCDNPILGATLGATLGIGCTPKFQPKFSERFFQNWGGSRATEIFIKKTKNWGKFKSL